MGQFITLKASDGHEFAAYKADANGVSQGGLVVVQEIFGVNEHIRSVCDRFAEKGFNCIAPALFDRIERNVELGYSADDVARGRALKTASLDAPALLDVTAAMETLPPGGKGIVGYCWGGYISWIAATSLDGLDAAVCYYGGGIHTKAKETPKCPTMLHFGERDAHITPEHVQAIRENHPDLPIMMYDADHGFNCDMRGSYDKASATLALDRTVDFFKQNF
ncbi:dienelactone hydrolase family protein [Hwanghaeella grinnelliae]|uniref:Dienelactone hydrolase family protein n=1 Tax=Hwanghaeella grinnelliae TaxID=2500179 RepID=A0A437QU40_9PROT|nr:dienelactone hydrolase family protein [Hwanghaeella grinnelliae]RVU37946.1 dienelactone hydrolase family protein [Hwanghaeella grinnelliae]